MVVKTSVLLIYQCVYDGAELGSTGGLVEEWSCPAQARLSQEKL